MRFFKSKRIQTIAAICWVTFWTFESHSIAAGFKSAQLESPRVRQSLQEKESVLKDLFLKKNIPYPPKEIFIRAFKHEKILEVWANQTGGGEFQLIQSYPFCTLSGNLGPKRRQGDGQVPEGFYAINRFNPTSNFYLSLGLDYPNRSDQILAKGNNLGGDIFIHGNCVSIGCIPLTDDRIKEVYLLAIEAKSNGQRNIPVHIFPSKMNADGMEWLKQNFTAQPNLINFWTNLKPGFDFFETQHRVPLVKIDSQGRYEVQTQ
jgi:murein L,D-transpeptidase YafK